MAAVTSTPRADWPASADPAQDGALLALGKVLQAARYRHVTVTPATHARVLRHAGGAAPVSLADVFGWSRSFREIDLPADILALMRGAGAAAIAIALHAPAAAVLVLDINDDALRMTGINAALAGAANVRTLHSDLLKAAEGQFDLIVANPPYLLDPGKRAYRHGGGEFGAALSVDIVETSLARLAPGGRLLLYTGVAMVDGVDLFRTRIAPLLDAAGAFWDYEEIDPDVFGEELDEARYRRAGGCVERIAAVWLRVCTARKGHKGNTGD